MYHKTERGFSIAEGILIVAIVTLLGVTGWFVLQQRDGTKESNPPAQTAQESDETAEINDANDLEDTEQFLRDMNIDEELNTSEIDATVD